MIATIIRFEALSILRVAQTWLIAAALALVFGFLFLQSLESYLDAQPRLAMQDHPPGLTGYIAANYLAYMPMLLAFIAPLFAMRSFSDEYRQHTMALWQSSPVSSTALVAGKFIGIMLVLGALVLLACGMLLLMHMFVPVDAGVWFSATLGLLLLCASFAAIGMFFSSLTRHAMLAAIASLSLILLLWLLALAANSGSIASVVNLLAIPVHLNGFFQGYLSSQDVLYFVILTLLFLGLTIARLDALRHAIN